MHDLSAWSKILLFGLIGALGCLIGGLFGEFFLLRAKPSPDETATAGLMFNPDLTARLHREGAKSGDVQISLMWNNHNDLDLHVIDPRGEEIFFGHRRSRSRGELDVDMNVSAPFSDQPVENIYWPRGGAPAGIYKVYVKGFKNHGGQDPTDFVVGVMVRGNASATGSGSAKEFPGRVSFDEPQQLVHEFTVVSAPQRQSGEYYAAMITGLWTGLLAIGLSLGLVVGQNKYLHRPLTSARQAAVLFSGGMAAGLIAGGVGQLLFSLLYQVESVAEVGRLIGWLILGGILGAGMSFFIPNLSGIRAAIAGAVGGLLGGLAFEWISYSASEIAARLVSAAILGFAIGLMVAIVEAAFREAWLEIAYAPTEKRTVSLGVEPVSIGGDPRACTVYARNAPPVAFRYKLDQGRITCEDVPKGQITTIQPGSSHIVGNLTVTVRGAGPAAQTASAAQPASKTPGGFSLRLSNGKTVSLADGVKFTTADIPGLQPSTGGSTVAEVGRNPNDPKVLGLRNLSRTAWSATLASRDRVQVAPGRNVRIAAGTRISFGSVDAEIE